MDSNIFIIAEAGVNHNGSIKIAKKLIEVAKESGADAVKFQTFIAEKGVSKFAMKADYQKKTTGQTESQLEMVRKLELTFNQFIELKNYCDEVGILFLSTAFDFDSIDFLNSINVPFFKIPSGEITNLPYLIKIAKLKKKVIMSTGMSSLNEVSDAINILQEHGTNDITVLHCTTEYPTPFEDVNLKAMHTLRSELNVKVGFSDHTLGITMPIAAAALGANIIEKHFTLDKNMNGPDHKASLDPAELKKMVEAIRMVEIGMGDGIKKPSPSEIKNIEIARKSIVASRAIQEGETFTEENLTTKRPGNGISPMKWFDILGLRAKKYFQEDELIEI